MKADPRRHPGSRQQMLELTEIVDGALADEDHRFALFDRGRALPIPAGKLERATAVRAALRVERVFGPAIHTDLDRLFIHETVPFPST